MRDTLKKESILCIKVEESIYLKKMKSLPYMFKLAVKDSVTAW